MNTDSLSSDRPAPETKEVDSATWRNARKPFWWALLATTVISLIGGFAIYLIHSTTPSSPGAITVSGKDFNKANSATKTGVTEQKGAASTRSASSSASASSPLSGASPTSSPALSAPSAASTAPSVGSTNTPGGRANQTSSPATAPIVAGTNPNTTPVKPLAPTINPPLNPPRSADATASLQWSKDETQRKKQPERSKPAVPNPAAEVDGIGSFPPKVVSPARPEPSPSTAAPTQKLQSATTTASAPAIQRATAPSPTPVQNSAPSRLRTAQDAQCADANFFSRLVCDERVRLRFCRDRWNEHPDCAVQPSARDL